MSDLNKISVFGSSGFIGGNFLRLYPETTIPIKSGEFDPKSNNILYLRSTTTNYNIFYDPYLDININLIGLIKVLENCKKNGLIFNFISSYYVYGKINHQQYDANYSFKETDNCYPRGFYSITKRTAEQLLISYCETHNIQYRIMRLSNIIGVGDKFSSQKNALQFLISKLVKNEPINLYKNGKFWRNYLDVEDTCRAIKFLLENGDKNVIYNIGNNQDFIFGDLINYCLEKLNSKSIVTPVEPSQFHNICQALDFKMNVDKLKNLGFKWKIPIHESLDRILADF